jgi:hypothetical protein
MMAQVRPGERARSMDELMNGQIVPALGQWQAAVLIVLSLSLASLLRRVWKLRKSA